MADMNKTRIRLQKVHQRLNKKRFPSNPQERNIVKANELIDSRRKAIDTTWRVMYAKGYNPQSPDEKFDDDFALISQWLKEVEKAGKKIDRICKKYNLDENTVMHNHMLDNIRNTTSY